MAAPALPRALASLPWLIPLAGALALFLALPAAGLVAGSLRGPGGAPTLRYLAELAQPEFLSAYLASLEVSALSALAGALLGLAVAWAVTAGGLGGAVRTLVLTFSGVASNFAGVPLAFAFTSALGPMGLVTEMLFHLTGVSIYRHGFTLFGLGGLTLAYVYFQAPLMVLVILPSLERALAWREAASLLGATGWQYARWVAAPLLRGPVVAGLLLLFGNAFGAYATAYALTSGMVNLVPIVIGDYLSGNVLYDPALGDALAVGMVVVLAAVFAAARLFGRVRPAGDGRG